MTITYEEQMAGTSMDEKNANLRAAVEARLFAKHNQNDDHPVLSDPEDESDDEPDPLHELHPSTRGYLGLLDELAQMHASKSHDYGSSDDPLANIRKGAAFVGIEPWQAAMVRLSDKVTRIESYNRTGRLCHESVEDSLLDLASYALLALQLKREAASSNGRRPR